MTSAQIDISQVHTWGDLFDKLVHVIKSPSALMFFLMNISGIYSSHTPSATKSRIKVG